MDQIELIEKRKPREKHFLQKDGTIRAEVYGEDVHYLKDGKYEEIDNTLIEEKRCFINKSNSFRVEFNEDCRKSLMKIKKDSHFLDFKMIENSSTTLNEKQTIQYKKSNNVLLYNINDNLSIEYQLTSNKVKETIIINNPKVSRFAFELNTDLILKLHSEKVEAYDVNNNTVFCIDTPFMKDSNGLINYNCYYNLEKKDSFYVLSLTLDNNWLNSPETHYPVYIDPTAVNVSNSNGLQDTYIFQGDSNTIRYDKAYLKAGIEKSGNTNIVNRTLIKFDLPQLSTGDEVIYARINLISYLTYTQNPKEYVATIHRVLSNWDETTASWSSMYNQFDEHIESVFRGSRSPVINGLINFHGNAYDGNITNLVKAWYKETPNYGIMIKSYNEEYTDDDFPAFYSKENSFENSSNPKPFLEIRYRNINGLENNLNYITQGFTGGMGYVNTYNGNLTTVFNLLNVFGLKMPMSLNLIYNTNDFVLNNERNFGMGFKLNYDQELREIVIDDDNYLLYLDEDGTVHYFPETTEQNIYKDEENIGITIVKESTNCIMTDSGGNRMIFAKSGDIYRLIEVGDSDNNTISVNYDNNRIVSLIDSNNNQISILYNSNNIVISGSNSLNTTLSFSNNLLTEISSSEGSVFLTYNNNNLISSITDICGVKIGYDYYDKAPFKLKKISNYSVNNTLGKSLTLDYGFNTTKITDNKYRCTILTFNNEGNLITSSYMKNENDIDNSYCSFQEHGSINSVSSNMILFKNIKNKLENTSFENSNLYFTDSNGIVSSISDDYANSGNKCLKCISSVLNSFISQEVTLDKGKYYTFSLFAKSDIDYSIELAYDDENYEEYKENENCFSSTKFERQDITIYYGENATSNLKIRIIANGIGVMFIDDLQLEIGEIASPYNIINNSDFSLGYSDWSISIIDFDESTININDYIEQVRFNNSSSYALKIKGHPMKTFVLEKTFPIKGNVGDLFSLSFWYKNNGIPGCGPVCSTNVAIYFKPVGHDAQYCIPLSDSLNVNNDIWQQFVYRSHAIEDYESIRISITVGREVNDFYITNLSFYKDMTSGEYNYDERGNLVSIKDQSNNVQRFEYDSNNNIVSSITPKGKNFKFEYDKNHKNRILSTISSTGLTHKIDYDSNGNAIREKLMKSIVTNIESGEKYKIRCNGECKYLKAELDMILAEDSQCSNTFWIFTESNQNYKISNANFPSYYISHSNGEILLSENTENNDFILEQNSNGSFHIAVQLDQQSKKYLKKNADNTISLDNIVLNSPDFEFYIEKEPSMFIETDTYYSQDGRYVVKTVDSSFNETNYNTNSSTGLLQSVENARSINTKYTYNTSNQITSVATGNMEVDYEYGNNKLISKISNGNTDYNFSYNEFNRPSSVSVNNYAELLRNTYESENGNLVKVSFGNNNEILYSYDDFDRINKITKMDNVYEYKYDNNGNVSKVISNNSIEKYKYDLSKRLYNYKKNDFEIKREFDNNDNIVKKEYRYQNNSYIDTFDYNNNDMLLSANINGIDVSYDYDELNRISEFKIDDTYSIKYDYLNYGKRSSCLIQSVNNNGQKISYKYDKLNNIKEVYENENLKHKYQYDQYNQLVMDEDYTAQIKYEYTYDNYGNIITEIRKRISDNSLVLTNSFTYNNPNWKDQLSSYNNELLTYDSIGNLTGIGNNISLEWKNGRELSRITDNIHNIECLYKYDEDGIRTYKKVNNNETSYFYEDGNLILEKRNNDVIKYIRINNELVGFVYNNDIYYYILNSQDDIIGILDSNYNKVVSYNYDAWGNLSGIIDISQSSIGIINPFRYRSYYYDNESSMYYLGTRYYNPKLARFISIDSTIGDVGGNPIGHNVYQYAFNNPINFQDDNGNWPKWAKKAAAAVAVVTVVAIVAAVTVATCGAGTVAATIAVGAAKGAVIGLALGAVVGCTTSVIGNRIKTGSWEGSQTAALEGASDGALSGAISGAITGGISSTIKVLSTASAWDSGTFNSSVRSLDYHYKKHVIAEGGSASNIFEYTDDAINFANRNQTMFKLQMNRYPDPLNTAYNDISWNYNTASLGGRYSFKNGKIITFWYK